MRMNNSDNLYDYDVAADKAKEVCSHHLSDGPATTARASVA